MLRELNEPAKFVFTTWPQPYKLDYYLSLGIATRNSSMPILALQIKTVISILDSGALQQNLS